MEIYHTKTRRIATVGRREVYNDALAIYKKIAAKTKRMPYVRSRYFNNSKVFLNLFWQHLNQKRWTDRIRRLKFLPCALELVRKSNMKPISKINPSRSNEVLHRFYGITPDKDLFIVQIKERKNNKEKFLISIFPTNKSSSPRGSI